MDADTRLTHLAAAKVCAEALRADPTDSGTARLALALGDAPATGLALTPVTRGVVIRHCGSGVPSLAGREHSGSTTAPTPPDPFRPFAA